MGMLGIPLSSPYTNKAGNIRRVILLKDRGSPAKNETTVRNIFSRHSRV